MKPCPICGNIVSPNADRCPKCGEPIKRGFLGRAGAERFWNVGCLIVLLIVGLFVFFNLLACGGLLV
jgi:hypothetical protein